VTDMPWEPPLAGTEVEHRWGARGTRSRATASDGEGNHASLRRLVCDLIEEYGRHTGHADLLREAADGEPVGLVRGRHADLLREAVDGVVGEDPPPGWRPSGADRSS